MRMPTTEHKQKHTTTLSKLTGLHEGHAPVHALGVTFAQQRLGNVALREQNRSDEVGIVHRFEHDLHLLLQQTRLHEETRLLSVLHGHGRIRLAVGVQLEAGAPNARDHQRDVVEVGQQESAHRRAIAHMLDNGRHRFAVHLIDEVARILLRPLDVAHMLQRRRVAPLALARRLGGVLEGGQLGRLLRLADALAAHRQIALGHHQLGDVDAVDGVVAQVNGAIVAVRVGRALAREVHLLADETLAQEFARLPGVRFVAGVVTAKWILRLATGYFFVGYARADHEAHIHWVRRGKLTCCLRDGGPVSGRSHWRS